MNDFQHSSLISGFETYFGCPGAEKETAESTDSRGAVFDLKCKDIDGTTFIIEIQNAPQSYFYERGLYYLCRIVSSQDEKGKAEGLTEGEAKAKKKIAEIAYYRRDCDLIGNPAYLSRKQKQE